MKSIKRVALAVLLLPLVAQAGDDVKTEGTLIQGPARAEDTWVGKDTLSEVKSKNWVMIVKVGEYTYTGNVNRVGGIFAAKGPKEDDWPLNSTVKVVFHKRMGSLLMDLTSTTGKKEEDVWVFSKKGADGVELCGKLKCKPTAEDSKD